MGSSNPRPWRGERLHHYGDGVCYVFVLFVWFLTHHASVGLVFTYVTYVLEVLQSVPPVTGCICITTLILFVQLQGCVSPLMLL